MKIDCFPFSLPLSDPLETAHGSIDAREGFVLTVSHDNVRGIGEATPLPGWTESLGTCERALERAIEEGTDPLTVLDCLDARETPAARHGLAGALADRTARQSGEALYRCLGADRTVEQVAVNATIGNGTPAETARKARTAVDRGTDCLKVKIGARSVAEDCERLVAVREAVPGATLRADANGAWSRAQAKRALDTIADRVGEIEYIEQPLERSDLAGHAALRPAVDVAIALDETTAEHDIGTVLAAGAADVLICKPMVLGGIDRTRTVARRARKAGVEPIVTTTIDGAIARAGTVHLAASLAPIAPCGLATGSLLETDLTDDDPAPITNGYADVPQTPGTIEAGSIGAIVGGSPETRR